MRLPKILPTGIDGREETHEFEVPPCCPVSQNPRPGSTLEIMYRPRGKVLEVGALYAYIHQFRGGLRNEQGQIVIRDMEGMIAMIAQHCADVVNVPVEVSTNLAIAPKQKMRIRVKKKPMSILRKLLIKVRGARRAIE